MSTGGIPSQGESPGGGVPWSPQSVPVPPARPTPSTPDGGRFRDSLDRPLVPPLINGRPRSGYDKGLDRTVDRELNSFERLRRPKKKYVATGSALRVKACEDVQMPMVSVMCGRWEGYVAQDPVIEFWEALRSLMHHVLPLFSRNGSGVCKPPVSWLGWTSAPLRHRSRPLRCTRLCRSGTSSSDAMAFSPSKCTTRASLRRLPLKLGRRVLTSIACGPRTALTEFLNTMTGFSFPRLPSGPAALASPREGAGLASPREGADRVSPRRGAPRQVTAWIPLAL